MTFSSFNLTSLYQRCSHCLTVEKITVVKIKTIQLYRFKFGSYANNGGPVAQDLKLFQFPSKPEQPGLSGSICSKVIYI